MNLTFQRNSWSMEGLTHAWSIRFAPMPEFHQQDDYIENLPAPVLRDGYSYVSLLTTDKISPKVKSYQWSTKKRKNIRPGALGREGYSPWK